MVSAKKVLELSIQNIKNIINFPYQSAQMKAHSSGFFFKFRGTPNAHLHGHALLLAQLDLISNSTQIT